MDKTQPPMLASEPLSTYRIKVESRRLITVLAQNEERTSPWSLDWSDEVYLRWTVNAAIVSQAWKRSSQWLRAIGLRVAQAGRSAPAG